MTMEPGQDQWWIKALPTNVKVRQKDWSTTVQEKIFVIFHSKIIFHSRLTRRWEKRLTAKRPVQKIVLSRYQSCQRRRISWKWPEPSSNFVQISVGYEMFRTRDLVTLCSFCLVYISWGLTDSIQAPFYPIEATSKGATPTEYGLVISSRLRYSLPVQRYLGSFMYFFS